MDRRLPEREHLLTLYARIDERSRSILALQPDWPCRRGCDGCCRRLASPPSVTRLEWELLREGIGALGPARRVEVEGRIQEMARLEAGESPPRYYVCPLLDSDRGECTVYERRPAACRTYGFYLSGGEGLWCAQILELVSGRDTSSIIWGSQQEIDAGLVALSGLARGIAEWMKELPPA